MLAFAVACLLLIVTPGPGVLSVAGVGSGFGFRDGSRYLWGLCLGNIMVGILVVSGLAAAVFSIPYVREFLLTASILYMIYLAAKVAFAGSEVGFIKATKAPKFRDGLALQAVNPKAYVANSLLFTGFGFLPSNLTLEIAIKFLIWVAIWIPIHFAWLWLGVILKRMQLPGRVQRAMNIIMALSMLVVVALVYVGK